METIKGSIQALWETQDRISDLEATIDGAEMRLVQARVREAKLQGELGALKDKFPGEYDTAALALAEVAKSRTDAREAKATEIKLRALYRAREEKLAAMTAPEREAFLAQEREEKEEAARAAHRDALIDAIARDPSHRSPHERLAIAELSVQAERLREHRDHLLPNEKAELDRIESILSSKQPPKELKRARARLLPAGSPIAAGAPNADNES